MTERDWNPLDDVDVLELMLLRVFMKGEQEGKKRRWLVEVDDSLEHIETVDAAQVAREVIAEVMKHKTEVESEAHPATRSLA